jgi:hypothetical protein
MLKEPEAGQDSKILIIYGRSFVVSVWLFKGGSFFCALVLQYGSELKQAVDKKGDG